MRLYVPATSASLRRLEEDGVLHPAGLVACAVTPWVLSELGLDDPEDEQAEHAVLSAASAVEVEGTAPAAVLVFDLPGADLPSDGLRVSLERDLPRRRLAAVHVCPGLEWYAAQELPDVVARGSRGAPGLT